MTRPSFIDRGYVTLNRATTPAAATTVRYIRGTTVISDDLPAAHTAQQIELLTEGGTSIVGRQFKWSLKRSELRWENAEDRPRRSDRIEWTHNGKVYVFEVLPEQGSAESSNVDVRLDWIPANVKLIDVQ